MREVCCVSSIDYVERLLNRVIREATGDAGDDAEEAEEPFMFLGTFPDEETAYENYNSSLDFNETLRVVCWRDPYDYCFRRR